jgi:hypothetical protein
MMRNLFTLSLLALLGDLGLVCVARGQSDPYKVVVVTTVSPFGGYVYRPDPIASRIDALGNYHIKIQQAARLREKARQDRLVTRRKVWEQWEWERKFRIRVFEEERERARVESIRHSQEVESKSAEVRSATILNTLLDHLGRQELSQGSSATLDPELVRKINVTVVGGHVSLLKAQKVRWPLLLQEEDFEAERKEIERLLAEARQEVDKKEAKLSTLKPLWARVDTLEKRLDNLLSKRGKPSMWVWRQYTPAGRFLKELKANVQLLQEPEVADFLIKNELKARNVAELVHYMRANGLRFAPAPASGAADRAYSRVHEAMARESRKFPESKSPGERQNR